MLVIWRDKKQNQRLGIDEREVLCYFRKHEVPNVTEGLCFEGNGKFKVKIGSCHTDLKWNLYF